MPSVLRKRVSFVGVWDPQNKPPGILTHVDWDLNWKNSRACRALSVCSNFATAELPNLVFYKDSTQCERRGYHAQDSREQAIKESIKNEEDKTALKHAATFFLFPVAGATFSLAAQCNLEPISVFQWPDHGQFSWKPSAVWHLQDQLLEQVQLQMSTPLMSAGALDGCRMDEVALNSTFTCSLVR